MHGLALRRVAAAARVCESRARGADKRFEDIKYSILLWARSGSAYFLEITSHGMMSAERVFYVL